MVSSMLAGCSDGGWLGMPEGATEQAGSISSTWRVFTIAALVVGGLVLGLILYAAIRFRRRNEDELPPQVRYNVPMEVLYTAIPIVLVAVLFFVSASATTQVRASVTPDVEVDVTAYQWGWLFEYPELGIAVQSHPDTAPVMALPAGSAVRLVLQSSDVVHSFYVPGFLYKHDVIPGEVFTVDIETSEQGSFPGVCAEFCGLFHHRMDFTVDVMPPAAFDAWVGAGGGAP